MCVCVCVREYIIIKHENKSIPDSATSFTLTPLLKDMNPKIENITNPAKNDVILFVKAKIMLSL